MTAKLSVIVLLGVLIGGNVLAEDLDLDPNGYILYCPCMGRFGNQADHFLGALSFAHGIDKTLVLPPWVEYRPGSAKSVQVPFDTYFQVAPLREYHRVLTMEEFMKKLAPKVWPVGKRTSYCYGARRGSASDTCNAKDGNPFGPFWDTFNIDFDKSEFYGPLHYDTHNDRNKRAWLQKYPVSDNYIMAFTGAPGSFPVREEDIPLQRYLKWSDDINRKVNIFLKENAVEGPLLGLHFRNGMDWERACEHVEPGQKRNMFASAQCLGFNLEHGDLTKDVCFPPKAKVLKQIKKTVKKTKAKTIFVAADSDHMVEEIKKTLNNKVKVLVHTPAHPHVDLAILGQADYAIANCVSTFSAFAIRERRQTGRPVAFWAFETKHDEL